MLPPEVCERSLIAVERRPGQPLPILRCAKSLPLPRLERCKALEMAKGSHTNRADHTHSYQETGPPQGNIGVLWGGAGWEIRVAMLK